MDDYLNMSDENVSIGAQPPNAAPTRPRRSY